MLCIAFSLLCQSIVCLNYLLLISNKPLLIFGYLGQEEERLALLVASMIISDVTSMTKQKSGNSSSSYWFWSLFRKLCSFNNVQVIVFDYNDKINGMFYNFFRFCLLLLIKAWFSGVPLAYKIQFCFMWLLTKLIIKICQIMLKCKITTGMFTCYCLGRSAVIH